MIGSIIGAGASLIGGILGKKKEDKALKQQREDMLRQEALQKEFAQNSIQWRAADAKAAGIHPLYAVGAQGASYSPVSGSYSTSDSLGQGIANAGQDIARGIHATRTQGQKVDAYTKTVQDLTLQRMGLENQLLSSQIAKVNQAGNPPAMAGVADRFLIDGQGNSPSSGLVQDEAMQRTVSNPSNLTQEPGAVTDVGYVKTPTGYMPVMSEDAKRRLEEDFIGTMLWNVRNRLLPAFDNRKENPPLPGYEFDPVAQEYRPIRRIRRRWVTQ